MADAVTAAPQAATALLALWNDVDPALDAAYNDWHAHEHVPERLTVPGMLWGLRYGRSAADRSAPRYLTLYGLRDVAVLDSEPYQRLLREPTPMSRTMRPALCQVSRWVCTLHAQAGLAGRGDLAVWTFTQADGRQARAACDALVDAPGVRGHLFAERWAGARPLPWLQAGQDHRIEGHWLLCARVEAGRPRDASNVYTRLPVG